MIGDILAPEPACRCEPSFEGDRLVVDRAVAATDPTSVDRDRLRVRLEKTLANALSDDRARPSLSAVNPAVDAARGSLRGRLQSTVEAGLESEAGRARKRVLGERLGSIPAGFPVAPLPGSWYATVNVWYVEIGGTYERFAVRSDHGDPTGAVTYLRDGRVARITRGDERLRLGSSARISFQTETAIVVVVPAGGRGVGDTGGVMDERSPGGRPGEPTERPRRRARIETRYSSEIGRRAHFYPARRHNWLT